MSLDVYLYGPKTAHNCFCSACGHEHTAQVGEELYSANVTHNLDEMASAAGLYDCCWRPQESGFTKAEQLIEPLRAGLALLRADPARFSEFNPINGWGSYEHFVPWVERYLAACEANPEADVEVSR